MLAIEMLASNMKLTDAKIKGLKAAKRYVEWDDGLSGLGVRVSPTGKRSFVFMYRYQGKSRMMTLGTYPRLTLADARYKASQAKEKVCKEIDPGLEQTEKRIAEGEAYTIKNLVDEYLEKHARQKKKSWREDERILEKDIVSSWGRKKAKSITRREIVVLLDEIKERAEAKGGTGIQANRTLALIRKMFNFGVARSIIETSPCVSIEYPVKENRRDRVLSEVEVRKFWTRLDQAKMSEGTKLALKLMLVTIQRKGEIAAIELADLDLHLKWWTLPKQKSKNNLPHRVPLTSMALEIIKEATALAGESKWLFPSARSEKHLTEQAIDRAVRNNRDVFEIDHFTPHDLRRSGASHSTSAGISRFLIKKILNHADRDITGVYDLHSYDREKRQALETWERKLMSILTGKSSDKVIPLKRSNQ